MESLIDKNFNDHASRIPAKTPGMQVLRTSSLTAVNSQLPCDSFNVVHIQNGDNLDVGDVMLAITTYKEQDLPYCIWVNHRNLTASVKNIFEGLKLEIANIEAGMVLELEKYETAQNNLHSNIRVCRDAEQLIDFAKVLAGHWSPPHQAIITYYARTSQTYVEHSSQILMAVYYEDSQPVSVIEMFSSDNETVGLYCLATLKEYRRRGIANALMSFCLNEAKSKGYKYAILQATDEGLNIYKQLGFETKTTYYEYQYH